MKVVVLAGGISTEREISISSGIKVCRALREKGHDAVLIDVYFGIENVDWENAFLKDYSIEDAVAYINGFNGKVEQEKNIRKEFFGPNVLKLCKAADIVFLALHGENGENGKVQAVFDLFGIPYTGSGYLGSALSMDKGLSKQIFRESGVPTPDSVTAHRNDCRKNIKEYGMTLPCVVKPSCGGSSVGVSIARTEEEFDKAVKEAFFYEEEILIEQYIEGREFSVGVVNKEAYPIIEIAPIHGFYDYHNKYQPGCTVETCPAKLSEEQTKTMQEYAVKACKVLRVESYGRVDFMMDREGNIYCLEMNTLPGMTPTSLLPQEAAVLGMSYADLCEKLIEVSLERFSR